MLQNGNGMPMLYPQEKAILQQTVFHRLQDCATTEIEVKTTVVKASHFTGFGNTWPLCR